MQAICKTLPEHSVVRDMDCIGDVLAPRIIAEIGDVQRFRNKHSLIAYAGISPELFMPLSERYPNRATLIFVKRAIMQSLIKHKPADNPVYDFI